MRFTLKIGLISLFTLAGHVPLKAIAPDAALGSYDGIPQRNVFGLRPPPTEAKQEQAAAPLPKITLTGITTILDSKRALMKVASAGVKQPDPNKELSLILTEGQREGGVEVLQIDEKAGSVKVRNSGTVMVLTFEKDGAKLPATAPAPGAPGAPQLPSALPVPATNPFAFPAPNRSASAALPGRNPRPTIPPLPGVAAAGGAANPVGGVPPATGLTGTTAAATAPALAQDLTPEERAIIMELQRQSSPSNAALLPATALTPGSTSSQQPVESTVPANTVIPLPGHPLGISPQ